MAMSLQGSSTLGLQSQIESIASKQKLVSNMLSSGDKIQEAWQDAAGLTIVESLKQEIDSMKAVAEGLQQGDAVLNIADGAMKGALKILERIGVLIDRARNGSFGDKQRRDLNNEVQELLKTWDTAMENAKFNEHTLLNGQLSAGTNIKGDVQSIITPSSATLTHDVTLAPSKFTLNGVKFSTGGATSEVKFIPGSTSERAQEVRVTVTAAAKLTTTALTLTGGGATVRIGGDANDDLKVAGVATAATGIAAEIAAAINSNTGSKLPVGFTATATGSVVTIQRTAASAAKYNIQGSVSVPTATVDGASASSFGTTAAAVGATSVVVQAGYQVNIKDIGAGAANNIYSFFTNPSDGLSKADDFVKEALSSITVENPNPVPAGTNTVLTIKSKNSAITGAIVLDSGGGVSLGKFESSAAVGSLGVGNIHIGGSLTGTAASWIKYDPQGFAAATTGAITIPATAIGEGSTFTVGDKDPIKYTFKASPDAHDKSQVQLVVGDTYQSLINLVKMLRQSGNPVLQSFDYKLQVDAKGDNQMSIATKTPDATFNGLKFSFTPTTGAGAALTLIGGKTGGMDFSKLVANDKFIGSGKGIVVTAKYKGQDKVDLTLRLGDGMSYTASGVGTLPQDDTVVRFIAAGGKPEGGYFDITFAAKQGMSVNADNVSKYAEELGKAAGGLKVYQTRALTSFQPDNGMLNNAKVEFVSGSFDDTLKVSGVKVLGKTVTSNGSVTVDLSDGRAFSLSIPTTQSPILKAGSIVEIVNSADPEETFRLHLLTSIDLSDAKDVSALQTTLSTAFKAGKGPMEFPISSDPHAKLDIAFPNLTLKALFGDHKVDISDKDHLIENAEIVSKAISQVLSERTKVGAYQSTIRQLGDTMALAVQNTATAKTIYGDTNVTAAVEELTQTNIRLNASVNVFKQMLQSLNLVLQLMQQ
ncbi:hypothetical protein MIDIC_420014 [Alphaproteobacteria bacterium]